MGQQLLLTPKQQQTLSVKAIQGLQLLALPVTSLDEYLNGLLIENPLIELDDYSEGLDQKRESMMDLDFSYSRNRGNKNDIMNALANGEAFRGNIPESETLHGFLRLQLLLCELEQIEFSIGEEIIGNINDNGYFVGELYEIAYQYGQDVTVAQRILNKIQMFSPLGVGANNVEECLILQVDHRIQNYDKMIELIRNDLEDLAERKMTKLSRKYKLRREELQQILDYIRTLNPRPGCEFEQAQTINYVIPDVVVKKENDQYVIYVNNEIQKKVNINQDYLHLIRNKSINHGEKEYLLGKRNEARMLLRNLEMRNETLKSLAVFLVNAQQSFFDYGPQELKPLMMQQAADTIGVHVSTISRAVQGKFIETPWGTFPLKHFFCSSVIFEAKEEVSSTKIKEKIRKMIKEEDCLNPLSDIQIAKDLKIEGICISRRTVAKYRLSMGIDGQNKRRRFI